MEPLLSVYEGFEGVGWGLVGEREGEEEEGEERGKGEGELLKRMRRLHMRQLRRGKRLRGDVERILSSSSFKSSKRVEGDGYKEGYCGEGDREGLCGEGFGEGKKERVHLNAFLKHISETVVKGKEYVLLAYMWVLYMALFSGGRVIRRELRLAGGRFWEGEAEGESESDRQGHRHEGMMESQGGCMEMNNDANWDKEDVDVDHNLHFWTFEGDEDGEDIKKEFKTRFAEVEELLIESQKVEVVDEAVWVMEGVLEVVREMSGGVGGKSGGGRGVGVGVEDIAAGGGGDGSARLGRGVDEQGKEVDIGGMGGKEQGLSGKERQEEEPSLRWLMLKHVLPMGMVELVAAGVRGAIGIGLLLGF